MTRDEIEDTRDDACRLITMSVVKVLGLNHGRSYTSNHIVRIMDSIREELFFVLNEDKSLSKTEHEFNSICLNNIMSIFEGMMLYKEGSNVLDLLYKGLMAKIKEEVK